LDFSATGFDVSTLDNYTISLELRSDNYEPLYKTCHLQVLPHQILIVDASEPVVVNGGKTITHTVDNFTADQLTELNNLT
jgi:hypothetical protein